MACPSTLASAAGLSLVDNARLFAMLYLTAADALITVSNDNTDGNPATEGDPNWLPLIPTPPYTEHSSGHSALSSAMVRSLQHFFGTDEIGWTDTNLGGLTRSYMRISQAIDEVVDARVWSGIHFRTADEGGAPSASRSRTTRTRGASSLSATAGTRTDERRGAALLSGPLSVGFSYRRLDQGGRTLRARPRHDRYRVPAKVVPVTVTIAGIKFDNLFYDREVDVLYLWAGEPRRPASDDVSPEGHYLQFGDDGSLIAITIVNARRIFERGGKIPITLPAHQVSAVDLGEVLAAA